MYGSEMGTLKLRLQTGSSTDMWSKAGPQGADWQRAMARAPAPLASSAEFVYLRGSGFRGDAALDDLLAAIEHVRCVRGGPVAAIGFSAGGHLVAALGLRAGGCVRSPG